MTGLPAALGLCALVLCSFGAGAQTQWKHPECRFRTSVTRPSPYRDDATRPAEAAADFAGLLKQAGIDGEFAPESLRLVEAGVDVPFAYRTEFDPRAGRKRPYVTWTAHPRIGETGTCDIYFDTLERGVEARQFDNTELPPENLLANADFEEGGDGVPTGWEASSPALVSTGRSARMRGDRSLQIRVDEDTPDDANRSVLITQTVDVSQFAGQEILFQCDLLAEKGAYGAPMTVRLEQTRADGTHIAQYAIQPRWLTVEMAQGQLVQLSERGRLSAEAATVTVTLGFRCYVRDADTGRTVEGPESHFTVWVDRVRLRPCERWPWPAASGAGFVDGAIDTAPVNRAFEFTGSRRLAFNGASEGTRTAAKYREASSVHWGLARGTLELWCRPSWVADDGVEHTLFYGLAYGHRLQSRLRKRTARAGNVLEFMIVDAGRTARTVSGNADLKAGTWHHLAATWDLPRAQLQLFADGRLIGSVGPGDEAWPSSLEHSAEGLKPGIGISGSDTRSMPMQAFIGGDHRWTESGSAEAAIDEFRISDAVRYTGEFQPPRQEFDVDENTRALFHFENEKHGVHDADDRFVRGYLGCELDPQGADAPLDVLDNGEVSRRRVVMKPPASDEDFEATRAENRMMVTRPFKDLPDPRTVEYRLRTVERVVATGDETFDLQVGGDFEPLMRSITFEHAANQPETTLLPRWRANDNVVPFSVESIRRTLGTDAENGAQRAFEVFKYILTVTNYYDAHYCETLPTRHRSRVSYALIKPLNIYPFDQCGPLNHTLRKLFLAAGISSNNASGTHHQFEQAFYDGSLRLFDLSSRVFWLNRDSSTLLSLRGLEEDPYLKIRQGGVANSWLPGRRSAATFGTAERPHNMDFTLRPGERASVSWHNEGRWFDLTGERKPIPLAKVPPYFGNGAVIYEPTLEGEAAKFQNLAVQGTGPDATITQQDAERSGSMVYTAACPYILSGGSVRGGYSASRAGSISVSVSFDEGKTWRELWKNPAKEGELAIDLADEITARYAYWLKLELEAGSDAQLRGLAVRSVFVVSPLSLPGKLALGSNRVSFVEGPVTSPIRTKCTWVERHHSDLKLSLNALSYYHNSGEALRNVFVVRPGETCPVTVTLRGRPAKGSVSIEPHSGTIRATPADVPVSLDDAEEEGVAAFTLSLPGATEGAVESFDVVLREDGRERRVAAQVLVADAALVSEAEDASELSGGAEVAPLAELSGGEGVLFNDAGEASFDMTAPRSGEYALWLRARWEPGSSTSMVLGLDGEKVRDLRATAMIGFTDWTAKTRAHTKMFAHFGEQYGHWSWYRIGDVDLTAGEHSLSLGARKGAFFDSLVLLPANVDMDRSAMNLLQNWNFAPWHQPM